MSLNFLPQTVHFRLTLNSIYAWGYNNYGQLGNNTTAYRTQIPVAVDISGVLAGKTITNAGAGYRHSIVLASDGRAYAWGYNFGLLGSNTSNMLETVPVDIYMSGVLNGKTITDVAAGNVHSVLLASDGRVYTCGSNNFGQLGDNSINQSGVPVAVDISGVLSGKTITAVTAGQFHSVALSSEGNIYAWGSNNHGQLGDNSTTGSKIPVAVDMSGVLYSKTITAVTAGIIHTVALASDGSVYSWGSNTNYGQLGNNSTTNSWVPVAVDVNGVLSGKTITAIAGGGYHTVALASDGSIYTWGNNSSGQLGNNSTTNSSVPVAVDMSGVLLGKTIIAVAAGGYHSVALASDGSVYTWGYNDYGQLGNNSATNSSVPVQAVNGENSGIVFPEKGIPKEFVLDQNYPNPFNPITTINFQLSAVSNVELSIYDMNGKIVETLVRESKSAGYYKVIWDASNVSSGIYFYRLQAGNFVETKKMVFMK